VGGVNYHLLDNKYDITYVLGIAFKPKSIIMKTLTATEARKQMYRLLDEAAETHQPIQITGKRTNAILLSEQDWHSIQETLYLISIPGMAESIKQGIDTPLEDTDENLDW